MTDSISIYEQYNIDLNKLSRDYLKFPLKRQNSSKYSKLLEYPTKEDLEYLYIELNLTSNFVAQYFGISMNPKFWEIIKLYNIPKGRKLTFETIKRTKIKKYGSTSYNNLEKRKQTCLERFGVDNALKSKEKREKIKQTCLIKYSCESSNSAKEVIDKKKKTRENKSKEEIENINQKISNTLKKYYKNENIKKVVKRVRKSKYEKIWLNLLNINDSIKIKGANCTYIPDGYNSETNTVYEFLGDYWHGNPEVFDLNDINTSCYKTFKELNEKTFERFNEMKILGYKVIYIWENDFVKYGKIKDNWRNKMIEY